MRPGVATMQCTPILWIGSIWPRLSSPPKNTPPKTGRPHQPRNETAKKKKKKDGNVNSNITPTSHEAESQPGWLRATIALLRSDHSQKCTGIALNGRHDKYCQAFACHRYELFQAQPVRRETDVENRCGYRGACRCIGEGL